MTCTPLLHLLFAWEGSLKIKQMNDVFELSRGVTYMDGFLFESSRKTVSGVVAEMTLLNGLL